MKTQFIDSAFKAVSGLETELTKRLRNDAVAAGWPKKLVSSLRVEVARNQIDVLYPDSLADIIEDLEYGNERVSPKPVFRRFVNNNELFVANTLAEWSIDHLFNTEVLP